MDSILVFLHSSWQIYQWKNKALPISHWLLNLNGRMKLKPHLRCRILWQWIFSIIKFLVMVSNLWLKNILKYIVMPRIKLQGKLLLRILTSKKVLFSMYKVMSSISKVKNKLLFLQVENKNTLSQFNLCYVGSIQVR